MGVKIRLIEGEPVTIGQKRLKPVVRAISWCLRRATVGRDGTTGYGFAAAWLHPVAVVEETPDGQRYLPIRDETGRAMVRLFVIALGIPLVLHLLARLVRARD